MESKQSRHSLFKLLLLAGFLLGVALLVQTASTYFYVYRNLVINAAMREADNRNQSLQIVLRGVQDRETAEAAIPTIEELVDAWNKDQSQVAWIRIVDQKNEKLAAVGFDNAIVAIPDLWFRVGRPTEAKHSEPVITKTRMGEAVLEIYGFYPSAAPRGNQNFGFGGRRGGPEGQQSPPVNGSAPAEFRGGGDLGLRRGVPPSRGEGRGGRGGSSGPARGTPEPTGPPGPGRPEAGIQSTPTFQPVAVQQFPAPPPANRGGGGGGRNGAQRGAGGARGRPPMAVEIAVTLEGAAGPFESLRRTLIVGVGTSLALMASLALIALRLPHHVRSKQIEAQLEMARRVQTDLLAPPYAVSPHVDFSVECVPAGEVGGDFCDVFSLDRGRVALVLGDVSGKGISAALLMGLIHGAIHSVSWSDSAEAHASATRHLNELLCAKTARERFSSLFWAYFDPADATLYYVTAGHAPPVLVRRRSGLDFDVRKLDIGGTVLGLLPDVPFEQGRIKIEEGDVLTIYSDGLSEAANTREEQFGEGRILDAVRESWDRSAEEIRDKAIARVKEFLHNAPPHDDQTLIVARFLNLKKS